MKKKRTARSAFFNSCILIGLLVFFAGILLTLAQRTADKRNTSANTSQLATLSSDRDAGALPTPEFPGGAIWYQYDNPATEPPINIGSQQFEPTFASLTDQAADDFIITNPPPPIFLYITGVRVMGEYSEGGGPASSFNVYIYGNGAGNLPGGLVASFLNQPYTGTPPDFTINLGNPFSLPSGTYWVSVQAQQDFNPNGQWFWHNRTVQSGNAGAAWQNPGDGYGTGCVTWNRKNACMPDQVWPDQVFQILGFYEGPTPTATATASPTASPTPTPYPSPTGCPQYTISENACAIVPGTTDTGNHCVWCETLISLPFPFVLYNQTFTAVNVSSSGRLDFVCANDPANYLETCLPAPPHNCPFDYTIFPLWYEWSTLTYPPGCSTWANGCGIFTSISGTAPNRIFNIEWHVVDRQGDTQTGDFEVRLYENDPNKRFDVIYGSVTQGLDTIYDVAGVQGSTGFFTQNFCRSYPPQNTCRAYQLESCATPTPTPTATATSTTTSSATPTGTPTPTARPTPTPRPNVTPRTRPTAPPR